MIDESKLIKKMIVLQVLGFIGGFLVGVALGFKLTSPYGYRTHPVTGEKNSFHINNGEIVEQTAEEREEFKSNFPQFPKVGV